MAAWHLLVFNHRHRPFQKNYSKWYHNQVTFLPNLFEKGSRFNREIWQTNLFCPPLPLPISGAMQLGSSHKFSFKLTNSFCLDWKIADNYSYIQFLESNYVSFKPYADIHVLKTQNLFCVPLPSPISEAMQLRSSKGSHSNWQNQSVWTEQ